MDSLLPQVYRAGARPCEKDCFYCYDTEVSEMSDALNGASSGDDGQQGLPPRFTVTPDATHLVMLKGMKDDPALQDDFRNFPWEILIRGDIFGTTIATDPFSEHVRDFIWEVLDRAFSQARLILCTTKFRASPKNLARLAEYKDKLRLVISTTGWGFPHERTSIKQHIRMFAECRAAGVTAFPAVHPYIAPAPELCELLTALKMEGYNACSVRGVFLSQTILDGMPAEAKPYYEGKVGEYVLANDDWPARIADTGMEVMSLRDWLLAEARDKGPFVDLETAKADVADVFAARAHTFGLGTEQEIIDAAIHRRLAHCQPMVAV